MPQVVKKQYVSRGGEWVEVTGGLDQATADSLYVQQTDYDAAHSVPTGFRNYIRNGDMGVAQRGDGPWTLSGGYGIDGFKITYTGGTCSMGRVVPASGQGSAQLSATVSGQAAAGDHCIVYAAIEGVFTLEGQTATLSFNARCASGTAKIAPEAYFVYGADGSTSEYLSPRSPSSVTLTTTMQRFSVVYDLPSAAGKIVGAGDHLRMYFWVSAGSTYAARASNIGIQSNTFYITDVQLEAGAVATPFERLPQHQQLAWCQRYFKTSGYPISVNSYVNGLIISQRSVGNLMNYWGRLEGPTMRAAPVIDLYSYDGTANSVSSGDTGAPAITMGTVTAHGPEFFVISLPVAGTAHLFAQYTASAEL